MAVDLLQFALIYAGIIAFLCAILVALRQNQRKRDAILEARMKNEEEEEIVGYIPKD